ncbi:MAG: hypothetical protein HS128_19100 [Ideonella sp.]|nr:hypothetical protein [Ideonella sp.]MCC7456002.1 hypothetical protein [Nitrospira sp.]
MLEFLQGKLGFAHDTALHLVGGLLVAIGAVALLLIGRYVGWGAAIAVAGVLMGWGVERYQAIRREGAPSRADLVASAAPAVFLGAAIELAVRFVPGLISATS